MRGVLGAMALRSRRSTGGRATVADSTSAAEAPPLDAVAEADDTDACAAPAPSESAPMDVELEVGAAPSADAAGVTLDEWRDFSV